MFNKDFYPIKQVEINMKFGLSEIIENEMIEFPKILWSGNFEKVNYKESGLQGARGNYIIKYKDEVLYTGVSINLANRLRKHYSSRENGTLFNKLKSDYGKREAQKILNECDIDVYEIENTSHSGMFEMYLVATLKPKYNAESEGKKRCGMEKTNKTKYIDNNSDKIIELYRQGLSVKEIADAYETNSVKIWKLLNECGVEIRRKNHDEETKNAAIVYYLKSNNKSDVARKFNVPRTTFIRWCKELGID